MARDEPSSIDKWQKLFDLDGSVDFEVAVLLAYISTFFEDFPLVQCNLELDLTINKNAFSGVGDEKPDKMTNQVVYHKL